MTIDYDYFEILKMVVEFADLSTSWAYPDRPKYDHADVLGDPQCTACDCQLTVKHILFECVDFIESRNRHFSVNSFKELFEKVPPDSILSYLHEIGLFYRL